MVSKKHSSFFVCIIIAIASLGFGSCSGKTIGYGVLLWFVNEPGIPSGVVLPVQVRSNIEQAWITSVPDEYKSTENQLAAVPLAHLEFFNTRSSAERYAASFSEYALLYAETLQDGLPIRDKPENSARRTYRLKEGEIIKILDMAEGVEAISTTGNPLEGNWYRVLTNSGSIGYCFSYRLRIFEHTTGSLGDEPAAINSGGDSELELILSRTWYPQSYKTMIDSGRLNLDYLSKNYLFNAGVLDGRARIHLEGVEAEFVYKTINKTGDRSWNFTGTPLNAVLHPDSMLELQFEVPGEDGEKTQKREMFVTLPLSVENVVNQEKERRTKLFQVLFVRGPVFTSANYGTLTLQSSGNFSWDSIDLLPEGMISGTGLGSGTVDMDYSLSGDMVERYTGALGMRFNAVSGNRNVLIFAYTLDNQGLRMEHIPSDYVTGRTLSRRASSPLVIYFSTEN